MNNTRKPRRNLGRMLIGVLTLVCATAFAADQDGEARVSQNSFYASEGRSQLVPDRVSTTEYPSATTVQDGRKSSRGRAQKSSAGVSRSPNTDFWFFTADVELYGDEDQDGYYSGISLLFDADTIYSEAAVYAVLYLSHDGGPWLEYAETDVFMIYGATSDDEFVVESDLLSGYPTGSYDILIELFDTFDNAFVADIGPESTSELSFLPLEDAGRDAPFVPPPVVIIEQGGGGAADPLLLAVLTVFSATMWALRRRRQLRA